MVSAILEVRRDNQWEYVADLYHWSTKRPQEIWSHDFGSKGMPSDVSQMTQIMAYSASQDDNCNAPTWLTLPEMKFFVSNMPFDFDHDFENWVICCEGFEARDIETRIVLWMREYT